jgi:hypothetical protein
MKYQLLFTYQSWIPPKAEDLQKLIKLALKPLLGNVRTRELKHYGINTAQWVIPIEVTGSTSATVDEIEKAIRTIEGAAGVRLFEVNHSEPPESGSRDSAPDGVVAVHDNISPPGDKGGGEK